MISEMCFRDKWKYFIFYISTDSVVTAFTCYSRKIIALSKPFRRSIHNIILIIRLTIIIITTIKIYYITEFNFNKVFIICKEIGFACVYIFKRKLLKTICP